VAAGNARVFAIGDDLDGSVRRRGELWGVHLSSGASSSIDLGSWFQHTPSQQRPDWDFVETFGLP